MARNPWKKLLSNVNLVATRHGGYGHEWSDEVRKCEPRPVTITWQYLKEQFIRQDGRCYWYGVELNPNTVFTTGDPSTLSVDRLDNSRGYEPDNVVITCRAANLGRGSTDVPTFIKFVESLKLPNNTKPVYQFFKFDNEEDHRTEAPSEGLCSVQEQNSERGFCSVQEDRRDMGTEDGQAVHL